MSATTLIIIACLIAYVIGYFVGAYVQRMKYGMIDWVCLRWNKDSLGYRPVADGQVLHRGQRVMLALPIPTDDLPEEGMPWGDSRS
tara:strand:+ start:521 stop:778 length:258 start_codon:yes stop_codon:yes gene_type:complete